MSCLLYTVCPSTHNSLLLLKLFSRRFRYFPGFDRVSRISMLPSVVHSFSSIESHLTGISPAFSLSLSTPNLSLMHHKVICRLWLTAPAAGLPPSKYQHVKNFNIYLLYLSLLQGTLLSSIINLADKSASSFQKNYVYIFEHIFIFHLMCSYRDSGQTDNINRTQIPKDLSAFHFQ